MTAKIDPGDTNQGRVTFLRHPWVISVPPLTAHPRRPRAPQETPRTYACVNEAVISDCS